MNPLKPTAQLDLGLTAHYWQAEGSTKAATDPASRISVLLLPSNTGGDGTLAVLPFFQEDIDLESIGMDADAWGAEGGGS